MINKLINLVRSDIVTMKAYQSARSEKVTGRIFLDANENPWMELKYNRYPEPQPQKLINKLAEMYNVSQEQILISRGSDEGIDLLLRLFCRADKDNIMICPPTYGMYQVAAKIQGAGIIEVPLIKEKGFALDVDGVVNAWQPNIKLIFLCSPNNPTGNLLAKKDIHTLCQLFAEKSIIVVDEAYIEFSSSKSLANKIEHYPNLVVLRTLSKAYGLAGLRCGVTLANPWLIQLLKNIIAPYPIATVVAELVYQQLLLKLNHYIETIMAEKNQLITFLSTLPNVKKIWPSEANFILVEFEDGNFIFEKCLRHGIVLRNRHKYGLQNCLRMTIGTPDENRQLREVLANA